MRLNLSLLGLEKTAMWARKRIDISNWELVKAIGSCLWPNCLESSINRVVDEFWESDILVTLSVRSGFDLLLKSAIELNDWPAESEIVFSGMTIADMPKIAVEHGLTVIGTDLNPKTMAPDPDHVASKITAKTKAIVVAHLMGGRSELDEIAEIAREHDLILIVDCAQSFTGQTDDISEFADVSMFSFGSIKTNTALGGAVLKVNDPGLIGSVSYTHLTLPTILLV